MGGGGGYKPVSMGGWGEGERLQFGDIMEALSFLGTVNGWMHTQREVMGAISAAVARERGNAVKFGDVEAILGELKALKDPTPQIRDRLALISWGHLLQERGVLLGLTQTEETGKILRLKKPFPLANLHKLWDSASQRMVEGGRVLKVAAQEAALRHPPVATGTPASWFVSLAPPPIPIPQPPRGPVLQVSVPDARVFCQTLQTGRAPGGGVEHPYTLAESEGVAKVQTTLTATMDGFVAGLQKYLGLQGMCRYRQLLSAPYQAFGMETFHAAHMALSKPPPPP